MEAKLYEPPEEDGIEITQAMLDAGVSRSMDFEEDYRDSEECVAEIYRAMVRAVGDTKYCDHVIGVYFGRDSESPEHVESACLIRVSSKDGADVDFDFCPVCGMQNGNAYGYSAARQVVENNSQHGDIIYGQETQGR